ncbi:MAG: YcfL family protein [Opitutaceae bacterium]|nr:YcfL family protein [Opitutaceae bacterium]
MKPILPTLAVLAALGLAGCQNEPGPFLPQETTKYSIENTEKFILMDRPTQVSVTCTGLQERVTDDGRLEVVANVKNRENRRIQVQVRCEFKDDHGVSTGDETPWQTLILGEGATEAVPFTSMNNLARKYTVAVRQAR